MTRMLLLVLMGLPFAQEEFDHAKVNRWIIALSEDPTQEAVVGELHGYLKKHDKLALVYAKFEESFRAGAGLDDIGAAAEATGAFDIIG